MRQVQLGNMPGRRPHQQDFPSVNTRYCPGGTVDHPTVCPPKAWDDIVTTTRTLQRTRQTLKTVLGQQMCASSRFRNTYRGATRLFAGPLPQEPLKKQQPPTRTSVGQSCLLLITPVGVGGLKRCCRRTSNKLGLCRVF